MIRINRYIGYWNLLWRYTYRFLILIISCMVIIPGGIMYYHYQSATFQRVVESGFYENEIVYDHVPWFFRLEDLMEQCGISIAILGGAVAVTVYLLIMVLRSDIYRENNVTIQRLPISKVGIYVIRILHMAGMYLLVYAIGYGMIFGSYLWYHTTVPNEVQMKQALYLATYRWPFLLHWYPVHEVLVQVCLVLLLVLISTGLVLVSVDELKRRNTICILGGYILYYFWMLQRQTKSVYILWCVIACGGCMWFWYGLIRKAKHKGVNE